MSAVIKELREAAQDYVAEDGRVLIRAADWPLYKLRIVSHNNFPTAAGLASSASGFACLTQSLASLYRASGDLSRIARQGSGSACRSMYGGWVQWIMGEKADGSDSIAAEVASAEHWPEMRVLIAVVSSGPKDVSSSSGMQQSVETSDLLKHRAAAVVPARMERMISAIERKDFPSFAVETIKDSNQFHAVCLDTYPPIFYMNDTSKRIVHLLDNINAHAPAPTVRYEFSSTILF
jgi:diphosphomevalonate decarboxylase